MSYQPTKIGNPCIHCGDTKGKCRIHKTREMHLCVSLSGSKKGEKSQGYVIIGDTEDGRWSQLLPDNGTEYSSEKIRELRIEWQHQEEQAKRDRLNGEMPAIERDKHYRDILGQLALHPEDKADLVRRGFTPEQIDKSGFKSVNQWQKLNETYPGNLPGINNRGDRLITHTPGYICPIRDADGLIVGLQVRKRVLTEGDDNRYYFLSTNSNIRVNDQIPLAVFPFKSDSKIWLVEGTGCKPFLTRDRLNVSVIGAAGGNCASSQNHLETSLNKLGIKPGDEVIIAPDAGSVCNTGVVRQYKRSAEVLLKLGYTPVFAWWGQVDKSFGDIDELKPERFADIRYLSVVEFEDIAIKWGGLIRSGTGFNPTPIDVQTQETKPIIKSTKSVEKSSKIESFNGSYKTRIRDSKDWLNWIESNKYTPDVVIKGKGDLVLPDDFNTKGKNVFIKSGLGTNKTGSSLSYLTKLEQDKGIYTILLSYINSLLHQTNDRARQAGKEFIHIQTDDDGKMLARDSKSNVSLCVHSLGYVDGHFSDRNVFVDEIESVLQTLVSGANLGKHQGDIIEMFFKGLRNSWGNLFTDGNATDLLADLIGKLTGRTVIKYEYQSETFRKKNFQFLVSLTRKGTIAVNDPSVIISKILSDIRAGKKLFVTTDSKVLGESIIENALKITFEEKEIDTIVDVVKQAGYKVFFISRNTSGTDEGKKFLSNPSQYIIDNQIDLVVGTPSIGSGVSVILPDNFFDAQYTVFCGVLSTKQQKQFLARLRNIALTHYVYCPVKSAVKDRNRPQQYSVTEYLQELHNLQQLGKAISMSEVERLFAPAKSRIDPLFDEYSALMGALDNFEQDNLLECLTYSLEAEGHNITLVCEDANEVAKEEIKEAKAKIQVRESEKFLKAEPFESTLEAESVTKGNPTPENHLKKDKTYFLDKLPGIDQKPEWNAEFILNYVIADSQQKKVNAITREFMLKHFDVAQEKYNLRMLNNAQKKHPVGKDLLPGDFGVIWALKELKFEDRVLNAEQFTCKSPFIQEMVAEYENRKDLQKLLKIEAPKDKVIDTSIRAFVSPLLALLGMKTEEVNRIKIDGVPYKAYKVVSAVEEKDRTAIYDCIGDKWVKWQEKHELNKQLESAKIQEELEQQANELVAEVRKSQASADPDAMLTKANIMVLKDMMMSIGDEGESSEIQQIQHDDLKICFSDTAWKLALSALSPEYADRMVNFGSPKVARGVFDKVAAKTF